MSFGPPPSPYTQSALAADTDRRQRRTRLIGAVAAVLVVVLCAGGWLLMYKTGDKTPASGKATAAPQAPDEIRETVEKLPSTPEGELAAGWMVEHLEKTTDVNPRYTPGTWATGKIFAKGIADEVLGFKVDRYGGDKAWTLKLGGHICATTKHVTADGRTAVVVQPPKPKGSPTEGVCDEVVFFDIDTGKKLWQSKMPEAASAFVTNTNLTMTRGTVAVAWDQGSVAYDMKDGKQLWKGTGVSQCEDHGFAGGRALLALVRCGSMPDVTYEVQKLDPRTGKAKWTYKVGKGITTVYLPSSDPPVLAVGAGDTTVTDLITLDADGKHSATISLHGESYDPMCGVRYSSTSRFGVVENCDAMVVGRTEIFVASKVGSESGQEANWIMGFDVATGKTLRKFDGREDQPIYPLRASGDQLLVYRATRDDIGPSAVISLDPRTGKETPFLLFRLPDDNSSDRQFGDPDKSDIIVEQGRVYFAKRELVADFKYPEDPVRAFLGIASSATMRSAK
ncbi:outer membrane protein assembly factor BamB family protein [Streptomyces sp. NBC_01236]|uniref:outer membrane protein assembly factor BamB family protein n=1 Tax=Streptomyces sp. NBC_01236 TaxID=2903789 RepID=UPI002E12D353|nr:PQQ-binding-like beta-propeller repeat protein [Streptomyces sp. NBC_01236]